MSAYLSLKNVFTHPDMDTTQVLETIDTVMDSDACITFAQVKSLLGESRNCSALREVSPTYSENSFHTTLSSVY